MFIYYISLTFGFRPGSFDKKPKINNDTKNITQVYTKIFKLNMIYQIEINNLIRNTCF